ncbi:c-type cytochrome biogenesis protein CcmI [Pseudooceanicola sp. 216_PA32_1]|uniref:C-type cytochrome biogenesis protein CcmI n=1 Tax=Pseudooceanicola pacificus TaxID=2676438 RepID=A0A844W6R8_9RHOB|nr:c-type cytochrome biogenesis protein CcmI [Pseudooceanicola pacificus]MWB78521.1 c-type cytochrome biogenesis protein CcmI [Pseudooceanicola pacificus]
MLFWILVSGLSLAVATVLSLAALRARASAGLHGGADVPVYKAQLAEVDRDLARGTIGAEEAGRLRNEIARRLLAADAAQHAPAAAQRSTASWPVLAICGLAVLGAGALYTTIGAPGYGDLPLSDRIARAKELRDTRPSQADAEQQQPERPAAELNPEFAGLMDRLRQAVATRPDDLQGNRLLARNEAAIGNFRAAYAAQERVLSLLGDTATDTDYADYGEMLVLAAGGYVSPEAETALRGALSRNPENGPAQYYIGLMMRQTGRPDIAFRLWDRLLRKGPESAPWIPPIRAQIDQAAALAGVQYEQPRPDETLAGPSAADIEAAGDLSAEDRQEMIRGMVSRLSERLSSQGGSAAEWARLIGAYGVLGDTGQARAIRDEALQVFAGREDDLATIRAAAASAGLGE